MFPAEGTASAETLRQACASRTQRLACCVGLEVRVESAEGFEPGIPLPASYQIPERTAAGTKCVWKVTTCISLSQRESALNVTSDLLHAGRLFSLSPF